MTQNPRFKHFSISRILPSLITLLALCIGITGIRYSITGQFEKAVLCILLAAILDGMDGRIARLLGSVSRFGAEIDSLADVCNFGVAPALIVYHYSLHPLKNLGWAFALFYIVCMVLRLARFNTFLDNDEPKQNGAFFTGVPAPLGAMTALLPMIFVFEYPQFSISPLFYCGFMALTSLLLVSKVPTFSFKKQKIHKKWAGLLLLSFGLFGVFLITETWITLIVTGILYYSTLPLSYLQSKKS